MASTGTDAATAPPAATVSDTMARINQICAEKGEPYSKYSCREVAWEDAERGTVGGKLSCFGGNVTDVRLFAKDGRPLYTVRTCNFDEKIGRLNASSVSMVGRDGRHVALRELLRNMGEHGGYAGVPDGTDLLCPDLDEEVGIRFQTTFLPVDDEGGGVVGAGGVDSRRGTLEFCVENYNYQTMSEDDPRNLLVLATAQGIAVQQDGPGRTRIYHHEAADGDGDGGGDDDNDGSAGPVVHRHWLEAERTLHRAGGGPQEESEEAAVRSEAEAAAAVSAASEAANRADRLREDATRVAASDDDDGDRAAEREAAEAAAEAERSRERADRAAGEARRRRELQEDALDAERRGRATSARIGTEAMGETCSAVLTVQVPLEQRPREATPTPLGTGAVCWITPTPSYYGETIGIDLGTTHSCVGVWQNDRVEIIANDQGNPTTPSVVAFSETERLVGDDAESQAAMNASNTIFDAKRLIGRKFSDPDVQSGINRWPFAVKSDPEGDPIIEVEYKGEKKTFKAEEISSVVLGKMREIAEAYLGKEAKNAVVTVPAHFSDSQRQATKDAGTMAGLNILRIINEPTAAAIAYGLDRLSDEKNVLVFDLGGGTFDVSILLVEEGIFEVLARGGDAHLGGNDFDDRMVDHFLRDFQHRHGKDALRDGRALRRLRVACERAKRTLSSCDIAHIEVDSLYGGVDYCSTITRTRFEDLCKDYFDACIGHCEKVLIDAKISKTDVDEIILVGGSTRIPKIRRVVSDFFDGKEARASIDPETVVACGAAGQAAVLSGADKCETLSELLLLDVTPLSFGVAVCYGDALPSPAAASANSLCRRVVHRNTTIPAMKRLALTTSEDRQSHVSIEIYQGERPLTEHNHLLARFTLGPLPPMPRGALQIDVVFDVGVDGILTVSASSGAVLKKMAITCDTGRLGQEDIEWMVDDAQRLAARDDAVRDALEEEARLRCLISSMCMALEMPTVRRSLGEERCATATELLDKAAAFLGADVSGRAPGVVRERRARLEAALDDVRVASEEKAGVSNAARVSRGTRHDVWRGLTVKEPRRDASQHCTVTVTMYNTVSGGVPSAADLCDAIDDLERLYDACDWCGRLADDGNGAGIGQAKRVQVRRALMALAMAGHPRLGADSPARSLPQDVLLLHIGSFLVPELGKLQELTPQTMETIRDVILGTQENSGCEEADHISIEEID